MKEKKGISLLVLVITIIIIIIIAGTVVLSSININTIDQANEVAFKTNAESYLSGLKMYINDKYASNHFFNPVKLNASTWNGIEENKTGTIKDYVANVSVVDGEKFAIDKGKLVYVGESKQEAEYAAELGIYGMSTEVGTIITGGGTTITGGPAKYNNPIIPIGFKAVNTEDASWNDVSTSWNNGLVIEDEIGNQFVWVPVDGTNVVYKRNYTDRTEGTYVDHNLPSGVTSENSQITKYQGFYVARYELGKDISKGTLVVKGYQTEGNNLTGCYAGGTALVYNSETVKSGYITGIQWDTLMKWIENSGKNVVDSRAWGNYTDSIAPANIEGCGTIKPSGFSEYWKAKNIYDLAGNANESTKEAYMYPEIEVPEGSEPVAMPDKNFWDNISRGGSYANSGIGASKRFYQNANNLSPLNDKTTDRLVLYIL